MNNANSWTSTIIARADAKNKIIDLRDGLRVSDKHEYAMMHSLGGKHGIKSTVKVTICDYTKESSSITVSANMVDSAVDECNHSLNGVFGQKDLFVYSCKCHMVGRAFRYYYMCL